MVKRADENKSFARLIYNPFAGKKRQLVTIKDPITLETLKGLLDQYQIRVELSPTQYPGHATKLAREAIKKGQKLVIVAGGDGTVGETINGLIGEDVTLAIIPLGSVMNLARMLSIPNDPEKAVELIKIGRTRKVDVGAITKIDGAAMLTPHYFLEEAGIGLEAQLHYYLSGIFERRQYRLIGSLIQLIWSFFGHKAEVFLDGKSLETRATIVTVANAPFSFTGLSMSPLARLNDHKFTVSLWKMSKWEIIKHIIQLAIKGYVKTKKIKTYQAKKVRLLTKSPRIVHADARIFGTTPVEMEVVPNALNIIAGFPKPDDLYLNKRTYLDPS
jgi:YegS/Rv2252/BmrU family lipid kinase